MSKGAEITYYLLLSLFPFLITLLSILKYTPLADQDVLKQIISFVPAQAGSVIYAVVTEVTVSSSDTLLSLSLLTGILTASKGMVSLIKTLNAAYRLEEHRTYFKLRLLAIAFTVGMMILIPLILFGMVFTDLIRENLKEYFNITLNLKILDGFVRRLIVTGFMVILFSLLYKFSPSMNRDHRIRWRYALPGAVFATFGWFVTSQAFSWYMNNFSKVASTYGSLWNVVILILWIRLSATVIIIGGEINGTLKKVYEVSD